MCITWPTHVFFVVVTVPVVALLRHRRRRRRAPRTGVASLAHFRPLATFGPQRLKTGGLGEERARLCERRGGLCCAGVGTGLELGCGPRHASSR